MRDAIEFFKAALRNPLEVSTIFPTSKYLAETLLSNGDFLHAQHVIELGAGTGAITKHLQKKISAFSYLGIELDHQMIQYLRRNFPSLRFEAGLAENMSNWAEPATVDLIVSSLPWTVFSDETQEKTIAAILSTLRPGGVFLTYICANALLYPQAKSFVNRLKNGFATVERRPLEWLNIPPAFVYKSSKR